MPRDRRGIARLNCAPTPPDRPPHADGSRRGPRAMPGADRARARAQQAPTRRSVMGDRAARWGARKAVRTGALAAPPRAGADPGWRRHGAATHARLRAVAEPFAAV